MPISVAFMGNAGNSYSKTESDDRYVNVPGDTMTGKLLIISSTDNSSLQTYQHIIVQAGQKVCFDGIGAPT